MMDRIELYPVVVVEDRYSGTYSGGQWLAVAEGDINMPSVWIGPHGDDCTSAAFWDNAPKWIATGDTPNEALAALYEKYGVTT